MLHPLSKWLFFLRSWVESLDIVWLYFIETVRVQNFHGCVHRTEPSVRLVLSSSGYIFNFQSVKRLEFSADIRLFVEEVWTWNIFQTHWVMTALEEEKQFLGEQIRLFFSLTA